MLPGTASAEREPGAWPGAQRAPQTAGRRLLLPLGLLAGLGWVLFGVLGPGAIGAAPLADVDEGAFAQASREMLASGDWLHTTLNGADRFDKPPLVYWLQALSLAVFGPEAFAVRLPSLLCAALQCLVLAAFVSPRWGLSTAVLTAGLAATMLGAALMGRAATADALLNLLIVAAALDLWRFIESAGQHKTALRRAALWMGLGVLTKGPVALLVPMAACALFLAWNALSQRLGRDKQPGGNPASLPLRAWADPWALALGATVSLPWYAYALHRHGQAFVDGFILRHNVQRFAGALEGHGGGPWYPFLVLPLLLLPWTPLLLPVLRHARSGLGDPLQRFLWAWAGFVLVFFAIAATKLPHYLLYGCAPLVMLMALRLNQAVKADIWAVALCALLLIGVGAASLPLVEWLAPRLDAHAQASLVHALQRPAPLAATAVPAALAVVLALVWALRGGFWAQRLACLVMAWAGLSAALASASGWLQGLQQPVRELTQIATARGLPLVQWQLHQPSAGFYARAVVPRRAPRSGEAALVRQDRFAAMPASEREPCEPVARAGGLLLVQCR